MLLRTLSVAVLALFVCASTGAAQAEKKDKKGTFGTVKKVDAEKKVLTVTVKVDGKEEDKEFDIKDAKFMAGKDMELKLEDIKEGDTVGIQSKDGKTATVVRKMKKPKA